MTQATAQQPSTEMPTEEHTLILPPASTQWTGRLLIFPHQVFLTLWTGSKLLAIRFPRPPALTVTALTGSLVLQDICRLLN